MERELDRFECTISSTGAIQEGGDLSVAEAAVSILERYFASDFVLFNISGMHHKLHVTWHVAFLFIHRYGLL